ncbi:MAG: hypothetical protein H7A52_12675 [Akkermansiaceae bacterium]|nr:hypothetical protein [Akkermansiaceae bacterium]
MKATFLPSPRKTLALLALIATGGISLSHAADPAPQRQESDSRTTTVLRVAPFQKHWDSRTWDRSPSTFAFWHGKDEGLRRRDLPEPEGSRRGSKPAGTLFNR